MLGVILAGGTGSRLRPLTRAINKHLLPVGSRPMIHYPVQTLLRGGIRDIVIVTGVEHMGQVVDQLGSGKDWGPKVSFTYKVQDEAGGIAQALGLVEGVANGRDVAVILGDNIFYKFSLLDPIVDFKSHSKGPKGHVFLKSVADPERFGVADFSNNQITSIEEKPKHPKTNMAVTGMYLYDAHVFEIIKTLKPSGRGELEITDVNNHYIRNGHLGYSVVGDYWSDAGTFTSLREVNRFIGDKEIYEDEE